MVDSPWQVPYEATGDGPMCYQDPDVLQDPENPPVMAEECLYLNIHRPSNFTGPLATMVYVHGGAFVGGSGG
jgi:para-nitrobenzyl esterase